MNNSTLLIISDTCMFFFGMCLGIIYDYIFQYIILQFHPDERHHHIFIGSIQIMLNALTIRYIRDCVQEVGLFTLGLITFQSLIIKSAIKN